MTKKKKKEKTLNDIYKLFYKKEKDDKEKFDALVKYIIIMEQRVVALEDIFLNPLYSQVSELVNKLNEKAKNEKSK